jgi:ATP-dependent exoDNAse (exonuclease V) beta subunit
MNPNETYVWQKTSIDSIPELKVALIKMNKRLIETDFESSYNHEVNARLTDDVNLLYVTFTRAKKQLYILADRPKQGKKLSELFVDFLQAMKKSDGPDDVYEHGAFCLQAKQAVSKAHVEKLAYQISAWRHKIDLV